MGTKQSTAAEPRPTPTTGPTVTEQRTSPVPLPDTYAPPPSSNLSLYSRDDGQYRQPPRLVAIMPHSLSQEETRPRPRYVEVDLLLAELRRMPPLPPPRSPTSRDGQRRERRSHHHQHCHHHHRRHGEGVNPLSIPQAAGPRVAFLPEVDSESYTMLYALLVYYSCLLTQKRYVGVVVTDSKHAHRPHTWCLKVHPLGQLSNEFQERSNIFPVNKNCSSNECSPDLVAPLE